MAASRLRQDELLFLFAALGLVLVQGSTCAFFVLLRGRSVTLFEEGEIILVSCVWAEIRTLFYFIVVH
jgi:hypothetical protein